jgi:hypothetical protein
MGRKLSQIFLKLMSFPNNQKTSLKKTPYIVKNIIMIVVIKGGTASRPDLFIIHYECFY